MTEESTTADESTGRKLSVGEKLIVVLCLVGIIAAMAWALNYSGIALFDSHMVEVLADWWQRSDTIGVIVAGITAVFVGAFVWWLARITLFSQRDPETLADITT